MIVPIASDHAGLEAKQISKEILEEMGITPIDFGTHSSDSVDYPDYAVQVSNLIHNGDHKFGILICGSGQGMCMTANKFPNIRAALVYSDKIATLSRQHNDANMLCLPGRELSRNDLEKIFKSWFNTQFEGGRHDRRVNKIHSLTAKETP